MPKSRIQRRVNPAAAPVEVKIDSLTQGVSQQPPHIRAVGQGSEQINGWSSPVEGLTKRNPMRCGAKVIPQSVDDFYLDIWQIDSLERYSILIWDEFRMFLAGKNLQGIFANPCDFLVPQFKIEDVIIEE